LIPLVAILACEADLTLAACAIAVGLRHRHTYLTFLATGGVAIGFALAVFLIWTLWFVAPGCLGDDASFTCVGDHAASGFAYLGAGGLAQWMWILGIALAVRRITKNRKLAHVSG